MLGAIAHWDHKVGLGSVGRRVLYQCYDYTARAFGARLVIVDTDDVLELDVPKAGSLKEALAQFESCVPVYMHEAGEIALDQFTHPNDTVYIVGPDYSSLVIPDDAISVAVETKESLPELWAHTALAVALHDRHVKRL